MYVTAIVFFEIYDFINIYEFLNNDTFINGPFNRNSINIIEIKNDF
jgi:hypothetical protein